MTLERGSSRPMAPPSAAVLDLRASVRGVVWSRCAQCGVAARLRVCDLRDVAASQEPCALHKEGDTTRFGLGRVVHHSDVSEVDSRVTKQHGASVVLRRVVQKLGVGDGHSWQGTVGKGGCWGGVSDVLRTGCCAKHLDPPYSGAGG